MDAYELLSTYQNYAVIGMNDNPEKYAYKIYKKLKEKGKTVYGVNPKYDLIDGDVIYNSIKEIPQPIDIAVFLVNPKIGVTYLETLKALNIPYVWLQPGAADDVLIETAKQLDLKPVEACVLALYAIHD